MDLKELGVYYLRNHFKVRKRTITETSETHNKSETNDLLLSSGRSPGSSVSNEDTNINNSTSSLEHSIYVVDRGIFDEEHTEPAHVSSTQSFALNVFDDASSTSGESAPGTPYAQRFKRLFVRRSANDSSSEEEVERRKPKKRGALFTSHYEHEDSNRREKSSGKANKTLRKYKSRNQVQNDIELEEHSTKKKKKSRNVNEIDSSYNIQEENDIGLDEHSTKKKKKKKSRDNNEIEPNYNIHLERNKSVDNIEQEESDSSEISQESQYKRTEENHYGSSSYVNQIFKEINQMKKQKGKKHDSDGLKRIEEIINKIIEDQKIDSIKKHKNMSNEEIVDERAIIEDVLNSSNSLLDRIIAEKELELDGGSKDTTEKKKDKNINNIRKERSSKAALERKNNHMDVLSMNTDSDTDSSSSSDDSVIFTGKESRRQLVIKLLKKRLRIFGGKKLTIPKRKKVRMRKASNSDNDPDFDYAQYVANLIKQNEANKYKQNDYAKSLEVKLSWEVAPLHRIEKFIGRSCKPDEKKQMEALGVKIKYGTFSNAEDQIIQRNFKLFCEDHNIPEDVTPFLVMAKGPLVTAEDRLNFARYLARDLDDRPLSKVYNRFLRICKNKTFKSGIYTSHEDNIILEYIKQSTSEKPFCELEKILNRPSDSICKRFSYLTTPSETRIKWTEKECTKFVKRLLKATRCSDVSELKDRKITTAEFERLSNKYNKNVTSLRRIWNCRVYPRVFATVDEVSKGQINEKIVDILIKHDYEDWRSVKWKNVGKEIEGFTSIGLYNIFAEMLYNSVPANIRTNIKDSLRYLKEEVFGKSKHRFSIKKLNLS